jgi:hypothetical protein
MEHVEMLGKLLERWWNTLEERNNWFDQDGRKNVKENLRQLYGNTHRDWVRAFPSPFWNRGRDIVLNHSQQRRRWRSVP